MIKICFAVGLALLSGIAAVEARQRSGPVAPDDRKAAPDKAANQAPDPLTDPMAVPRWFGSAVDDILTGTSRALNFPDEPKK